MSVFVREGEPETSIVGLLIGDVKNVGRGESWSLSGQFWHCGSSDRAAGVWQGWRQCRLGGGSLESLPKRLSLRSGSPKLDLNTVSL